MNISKGFRCPENSNWTIFCLLSQSCSQSFPTFPSSYWEANSYYPREREAENEKMVFTRNGWYTGVWVPGAFKLDHLLPVKPILFSQFSNFSTFILGGQFLLPQREEGWKWEKGIIQPEMKQRDFSAWGIQTGPFAALWAHIVPKDFQLFHFHTGRPILITPEG